MIFHAGDFEFRTDFHDGRLYVRDDVSDWTLLEDTDLDVDEYTRGHAENEHRERMAHAKTLEHHYA